MEKKCDNCKHLYTGEFEFPCNECSEDENGNPVFWESKKVEEINHPLRYKHGEYECIDVMLDNFGKEAVEHFCLLNAFKYVWRSDYKNGTQDIKKAMWYLDKYLELEGEKHDN